MNSLEQRLQVGLAASLIALMVLLGWAQMSVIQNLTESFITSRLQHDSESLLSTINFDVNGKLKLNESRLATVYTQPYSGHYYQIVIADEVAPIRSRSLWDTALTFPIPALGKSETLQRIGPDSQLLLLYTSHYQKQGYNITIAVAEDISPLKQQLLFYSIVFIGLVLAAVVILFLVQRHIVKSAFRPLKHVHHEITQLSEGQQGRLGENVPDEIKPLVSAVNHLLLVITQRFERSRNALGNLAHSIKGPLNLMTQLADSDEIKQHPAIHEEIQEHTGRIQQIINHELKRARLAGVGMPGQLFEPSKELPDLIKVLQQMYRDKALKFECNIAPGTMNNIERDDMLELIGNLLDNSCKWAKHRIKCTINIAPTLEISVEDDGEGCSDEQLSRITQRGIRVDESVAGHGLGLTIVKEIAQIYQLNLQLDKSPSLGGLRVQLVHF